MTLRCTIELLPGGDATRAQKIGVVEITRLGTANPSPYAVVLKKCPPYSGALHQAWKKGAVSSENDIFATQVNDWDDDEIIAAKVGGFDRVKRGCYDLLYLALKACGLDKRNG